LPEGTIPHLVADIRRVQLVNKASEPSRCCTPCTPEGLLARRKWKNSGWIQGIKKMEGKEQGFVKVVVIARWPGFCGKME
jgi:hypothetical protein